MDMNFTIEQKIKVLSESDGGVTLELNRIRWRNGEARLDLRKWGNNKNGDKIPYKGVTLSDSEAMELITALESAIENKVDCTAEPSDKAIKD